MINTLILRLLPLLSLFIICACQQKESNHGDATAERPIDLKHSFIADQYIARLLLEDKFLTAQDSLNNHLARPQVQSDRTLQANAQYFQARLAYEAGDFPLAMSGARKAIKALTLPIYQAPPETTIQCLHLLAELHFDHAAFTDSIGYYQRWAEGLIDKSTPAPILAEQQLCYALAQLFDYEYKTQISAARLGKSYLSGHPELNNVHARLLVAEGLGLKKHADQQKDSTRLAMLHVAADLMTQAKDRFQKIGSIRWREAQREKVIVVARFLDREWFDAELHPLLLPTPLAPAAAHNTTLRTPIATKAGFETFTATIPFGFPDRLRGYFHHRLKSADSTLYYYQKFQPEAPVFDFHLNDETYWTIIQYGIIDHQLSLAEKNVRDQLVLYQCLGEADKQLSTAELLRLAFTTPRCTYALCDYGRVRLAKYTDHGDLNALREANTVFQLILKEWEYIFTNGEEESALNQLSEITYKIINNANEMAYLIHQVDPSAANANRLLQTMERTKAFLLLRDRFKKQDDSEFSLRIDSLKVWQSQMNVLKEREARTGVLSKKERLRMRDLRKKHLELNMSIKKDRTTTRGAEQSPLPKLQVLQNEQSSGQGTLVFATGNNRLLGQYFDQDTTIVFATNSLSTLEEEVSRLLGLLKSNHDDVSTVDYITTAHLLFQQLIEPIKHRLPAINELLIIPAGPLRQLPFATLLIDSSDQQSWNSLPYLLNQVVITYSPSLRLERINTELRPGSHTNATIGSWTNPQLDFIFSRTNKQLEIAVPVGSKFYYQQMCSTNSFRRNLDRYDIINLTLHAAGDPYNAYQNYLYFSPTDSLNGAAISQLNTNATLVLLTACETGLGTTTVGEGTFSISRGFQQIGVPDVVYSLYKISAAASAELTQRFYYHLYAGKAPATALTLAQRELMTEKGRRVLTFPGYWGGMVKG